MGAGRDDRKHKVRSRRKTGPRKDGAERLKFVLASFNTGVGHVEDAQRLAEKHGDNPNKWDDVAYWLLQKSKAEYYTDPVVKYGFCRGIEPEDGGRQTGGGVGGHSGAAPDAGRISRGRVHF